MKLRTKMVLAGLPLAIVLATVTAYAVTNVVQIREKADAIFVDNYRSVLVAQRMNDAVDEVDRVILASLRGEPATIASLATVLPTFEAELVRQEHNITEPGEREATSDLRVAADRWRATVDEAFAKDGRARWGVYVGPLREAAARVKGGTQRILVLNEDAMLKKASEAGRFSDEVVQTLSWVSLGALVIVLAIGFTFSDQIARPLVRLARSAHRIGEGDLDSKLDEGPGGSTEVDTLVREFARMVEKLRQYRQSSLGELLEATESAQAAIDSLVDPVVAFNEDGSFRRANACAKRILGVDADAEDPLAGMDESVRAALVRVRDSVLQGKALPAPRGFENAVAVLIDGSPRYLQPVATAVRSETTEAVIGVTVLLRDVTSLRRADELKTDLLSTVAHEIRTPLTSIRMACHLCLERAIGPLTDKQDEILSVARDDADRLHNLVEGILSVSKIEAGAFVGRRHPATPHELIDEAVKPVRLGAADKRIALDVKGAVEPRVDVDGESIVLVLSNFLTNALKHTPAGGSISVDAVAENGSVRFEVKDTGPGIAREHQARIFEKFYRVPGSPAGGTGLGLSIARDIVLAHDGEIGVESEPEKGSRFWFRLPAIPLEGSAA